MKTTSKKNLIITGVILSIVLGCSKLALLMPTILTSSITNITSVSATGGGNATADGGVAITSKGVCWSTTQNPTTAGSKTNDGSGTGSFTSSITGLSPGTTYYVRAYATNTIGTSYGSEETFITSAVLSAITTTSASSVTNNSAVSGGTISSDGGSAITQRGVCWSTSQNPTTADSKTSDGTGTGTFSSNITGLNPGTTYYVRAYSTNSIGTAYGNQVSFTTAATVPVLTTTNASSVTSTSASSGGNISNDGGASVTSRGVCWSTSQNPTISNSKTTDGTGTGVFTSSITGLSPGTTYYARAYATNSAGTGYGNQVTFTTPATPPVITTTSLSNITTTSFTTGGTITSDGGAAVTARGVCWSTTPNPTTANSKTTNGTGTGTFTSSVSGLTPGITYYVRAYATNSAGTSYGNELRANGLTEDINNLVPESIIDELKRLGMPVNTGFTPPDVTGIYRLSPFVILASNIPNDWPAGSRFTDVNIRLHEYNNNALTISYQDAYINYDSGAYLGGSTGTLGYIVGNGNNFTVFIKVISTDTDHNESADLVYVISGVKSGVNILNAYWANFMLDNKGSTNFIQNGQGRVFKDEDGFSPRIESLTNQAIQNKAPIIKTPVPNAKITP